MLGLVLSAAELGLFLSCFYVNRITATPYLVGTIYGGTDELATFLLPRFSLPHFFFAAFFSAAFFFAAIDLVQHLRRWRFPFSLVRCAR